jgi:hypothetical protein
LFANPLIGDCTMSADCLGLLVAQPLFHVGREPGLAWFRGRLS